MNTKQFFAQIDENNMVVYVSPVTHLFMAENPDRYPGTWVETFFDTPNKTYAGIGFIYDPIKKDFHEPIIAPSLPVYETPTT